MGLMSIQVISFKCVLKNKAGQVISFTYNRDVLNAAGGNGVGLKGLAEGLSDLSAGEHRTIALPAEEAYGLYDPARVILFPKKKLSGEAKVGAMVSVRGKSGKTRIYKVLQIMDGLVKLDGNHPLAGQDLIFEIEALSARDALPEEIEDHTASVLRLN